MLMNWNILGHEWAVDLLKEHVARQDVRHAYLFTGPQGVGRRTLALRLAQALNCLQPPAPGEACYACRICVQTEKMQQPDLSVVQSERIGGTLKVEQIRELQHDLALHPYEARYRVAALLRFEEAHPSAMNALLKTLEEPGPQVVIVLTAESAERLLPTIVSRCEILRLKPLPLEVVDQGLQNLWGLPAEKARLLAHLSGGRPGSLHEIRGIANKPYEAVHNDPGVSISVYLLRNHDAQQDFQKRKRTLNKFEWVKGFEDTIWTFITFTRIFNFEIHLLNFIEIS